MEVLGTAKMLLSSVWGFFYQLFGENHFYMNVIGTFKSGSALI